MKKVESIIFVMVVAISICALLAPHSMPQIIAQDTSANGIDLDSIDFERVSDTVSIIDADDFPFESLERSGILTKNMSPRNFLEVGKTYYVIREVEPRLRDLPENTTRFVGTVGYAFQPGVAFVDPPKNVTQRYGMEYFERHMELYKEFVEASPIGDSYEFAVDPQKPFLVRFAVSIDEVGKYTRLFYSTAYLSEDVQLCCPGGMATVTVVGEYSKAIGEDGRCKMSELTLVIKHDYSTIVCTTLETKAKLQSIGWAR